jgi:signal transduction histidine kinase/DNA-binding response OmpR family regulator
MNVKRKKRSLWAACRLIVLLAALPGAGTLLAQGQPAIRNYPPDEYGAHNQNWTIVQDARGVMYFGNSHGVLEYDGVSWRLIPIQRTRIARSLAIGPGNRVYAGGYAEFGYLDPDSLGRLGFVSLLPYVEERYRDFTDVWKILATPQGTFFTTDKHLFRWDGQNMRVWTAQTAFHSGFWINDQFYIQQDKTGLMQLSGDALRLAPMGEKLADEPVSTMLPFERSGNKSTLVATRDKGLFLYDGNTLERFNTEVDEQLVRSQVLCATALSNGRYALGTMQGGVFVIDAEGRLLQRLHKAGGFQDDAVLSLSEDRQGGLWAGLQVGIARAEMGGAYNYFGPREGFEGSAWEMLRHDNRLWAATIMGLFYLDDSGQFRRMTSVPAQCWALLPVGQALLVATFDGVFEIRGDQARRLTDRFTFSLHRSRQDPKRVFAGLKAGVQSLYYEDDQWRDEGRWEDMDQEIRHFYETPDGQLWLTDYFKGLVLAKFPDGDPLRPELTRFDTLHGLPPPDRVIAFSTDKGLRFATLQGIFKFDATSKRFARDSSLVQGLPGLDIGFFAVGRDRQGSFWLVADDNAQSGVARRQSQGVYVWDQTPFLRIADWPVFSVYPDPSAEQVTWIAGPGRLARYDGTAPPRHALDCQTLIREIIVTGETSIYGGAGASSGELKLPFSMNSLRFRYAAASFDEESKNVFQYFLEGYDDDWSAWTAETYKDYTRLPPGRYRFLVRARNIYGQIGETGTFDLQILPPFYRSWWAYLWYALLLAGLAWQLWRYALKRIQARHQRELEQVEYNKLKELDELKSRFFADISHEFRTPLTLILGPMDKLLAEQPQEEHARQFHLVKRNAQRLLNLINQLLDLSKLEAGKMQLEQTRADIIPLLRGLAHSFESLVESKKIALHFSSALPHAFLDFDRDKMEQIIANLISNAIKFTPAGGTVHLEVQAAADGRQLQIEVRDTGPGIPAEHLPRVFERFHQAAETAPGGELGSGIGLALAKELAELHGGSISASNIQGGGACFRLLLPYPAADEQPTASFAEAGSLSLGSVVLNATSQVVLAPKLPQTASAEAATLLLVEDNADMRAFIREALTDQYQVIEAADGQEGIAMALEHIPDLIISDVMMPRVDGLELCGALKSDERSSHIPIVLLTAKADIESRLAGLERGADDYLAKPFNRDELLLRTRNLLESRRRLRERYASLQPPEPAQEKDLQIEDAFLLKVRGILEAHLSDTEFEIDQLSRALGMSRSQLFRKIKALTGQSPSIFIRKVRLQRGRELLLTTEMNVSEVAYEVGFSTPGYFSDAFVEAFGVRPSQVRG